MGPKVSHEQGRKSGNGTGNVTCRYQNVQNGHKSTKKRQGSRSGEERNGAPFRGARYVTTLGLSGKLGKTKPGQQGHLEPRSNRGGKFHHQRKG